MRFLFDYKVSVNEILDAFFLLLRKILRIRLRRSSIFGWAWFSSSLEGKGRMPRGNGRWGWPVYLHARRPRYQQARTFLPLLQKHPLLPFWIPFRSFHSLSWSCQIQGCWTSYRECFSNWIERVSIWGKLWF